MAYYKRIADQVLQDRLDANGAVLIQGAKWCGKTTTALQIAKSSLFMQDPQTREQNLRLADIDPMFLLEGDIPRLLDEWQLAPKLWDAVRFAVDQRNDFGQFILTGSAVPFADMSTSHSGTGRIARMTMRPMSLFESEDSNAQVSLRDLFQKAQIRAKAELSLTDIAFLICRGGWPSAINRSDKIALRQAIDYLEGVIESDISRADGVSRNPMRVRMLLRSYARMIGTQASITSIREDMVSNDRDSLDKDTISSYISALKLIFVIEELEAWIPNLRSRTAIRTSNTRFFVDPSIASSSLRIGPMDLINDLKTMGFLFESLCIRDLRVYADALEGDVYRYRDANGLECDAVVHLRDGRYGLIEIKLGGSEIEPAAKNLLKIVDILDTTRMKEPSFLMVLTGTQYAYQREDGVYVVPVGCLRD
ncbi:MAG: ATP-binding protein [Chloroflexi bacterium]|jgi:predicted AAA+ superfamily ATPase|nr:ATP-binding protein [Chloroflexota bacterium]